MKYLNKIKSAINKSPLDEMKKQGDGFYKSKKWKETIDVYQRIFKKKYNDIPLEVYAKLAIAQRFVKDYNGSEETLKKGLEKFPEHTSLFIEYAALENVRENWGKAVELWEKSYEKSKKFSELNYKRYTKACKGINDVSKVKKIADSLYKEKQWKKAISIYSEIINENNKKIAVDIYAKLAIAQRFVKDYSGSEETLNKGLKEFPEHTSLLIEYAALENVRENWEKAVELWEQAKKYSKDWSLLNYQRYLFALEQFKDIQKLKILIKEGIEKFPMDEKLLKFQNQSTRLKVAVQFYGHSRSFKETFPSFKKYILDENQKNGIEIDIFIHTLDEKEHSTIKLHYTKDFDYVGKKLEEDDIKFIKNNYKPKALLIEPQQEISKHDEKKIMLKGFNKENYKIINNISYTMFQVNELRKNYNKEYDFVLMTRLDIVFFKPFSLLDLIGNRVKGFMDFNSRDELNNVVFYPYMETPNLYRNQNKYITGIDLLILGSSQVLDKISSWYLTLFDNPPRGTENSLSYIVHDNKIEKHLLYYSKPDSWSILRTNDVNAKINDTVKYEVNLLQDKWSFSRLEFFYENSLKVNHNYLFEYIVYLADIGRLDKLNKLLLHYGYDYIESLIKSDSYVSNKKNNVSFMLKFYKDEYIPNSINPISDSIESKIMYFTNQSTRESLLFLKNIIMKNNSIFKIDGKVQMLLNFVINQLIEKKLLDASFAYNLIEFYCEDNNINKTRKKYMIASLIDYFEKSNSDTFFNYLYNKKGYIQKVASTIHRFGENEEGAKYYQNKLHKLVKLNSLNYQTKLEQPKIAICISGMIRGNAHKVIQLLEKNIIQPLNADIFIHTWDIQHSWMGIGGDVNWVYRLFGGAILKKCPAELKHISFLQKNFPHIYNKLENVESLPLNEKSLKKILISKDALIENEGRFLDNLPFAKEKLMSRGHFNQAKMFYGIYKVMKLMEDYENKNKIKYDYVVRCRPDIGLNNELKLESLNSLEENEVLVDFFPYGVQDQFRAGKRDTMFKLANIWEETLREERLSPFNEYPDIDAHNLIYLWMIQNNMITVPTKIKRDVSLAARYSKIPSIEKELEKDLMQISDEYKNRDDFKEFFQLLMEKK